MAAHLKTGIEDLMKRIQSPKKDFESCLRGLVNIDSFASDDWGVYTKIYDYLQGKISLRELEQHLYDILVNVVTPEWESLGQPKNREEWLGRKWWGNDPHLQVVAQGIKMLKEHGFDLSSVDLDSLDQEDYPCSIEYQLEVNIFGKPHEWFYQHGFMIGDKDQHESTIKDKDQAIRLDTQDYQDLTSMWKELLTDERKP